MTDDPDPRPAPSAYRWAMLGGVWLVYYCFGLTTAAMAPLVSPITAELGISNSTMGLILGAWPLVYIAAAIPCGMLLDRLGARMALTIAAFVMGASGAARGLAGNEALLFAAVGLFGIGGPLVSIGAPKLIAERFEGADRGTAMGIYITGPSLGAITALSLTNSLLMPLTGQNWRMVPSSTPALSPTAACSGSPSPAIRRRRQGCLAPGTARSSTPPPSPRSSALARCGSCSP